MKLNKLGIMRVSTFLAVFIVCAILVTPSFLQIGFAQPTFITSDKAVNSAKQFRGWNAAQTPSYVVFTELRYLKEDAGWLNIYTVDVKTGKTLILEQSLSLQIPDTVVRLRGYYWYVSINTNPNADVREIGSSSYDFWVNAYNATVMVSHRPCVGDWQLGWTIGFGTSTNGKGINANVKSDGVFLKGDISILEAFFDNAGYWINMGDGNNTGPDMAGHTGTAPCVWEEVINPNNVQVAYYILASDGGYGGVGQFSIIYDTTQNPNRWGWFLGQGELSTYNTGGSYIHPQSYNIIENISKNYAPRSSSYTSTLFTNGLQYCTSAYNGVFPTMTNPSSLSSYNNYAPSWFTTTKQTAASGAWILNFTWGT